MQRRLVHQIAQARMAELDRQSLRLDAARRAHYKVTHCIEAGASDCSLPACLPEAFPKLRS